jgi:hypothetical protein
MSPARSFRFPDTAQSITMLVFLAASVAVIAMAEAHRRHNKKLRCGHAQLEDRVKDAPQNSTGLIRIYGISQRACFSYRMMRGGESPVNRTAASVNCWLG